MPISIKSLLAVIAAALALSGCVRSLSGDVYQRGQAMRAQSVEMGVVEAVRNVRIQGRQEGIGTLAGAVLGGLAGSTVGGGSTANAAGAVAGAVIGGVAGNAIEEGATAAPGQEVTVKLDSGRMIAIVQEATEHFRPGDRVRVLSDGRTTRVTF